MIDNQSINNNENIDNISHLISLPNPSKYRLNGRQEKFILAYLETKNITKALKIAGYAKRKSGRMTYLMTTNPRIQAAIADYRSVLDRMVTVSFADKVSLLWDIATRCARPRIEQVGKKVKLVDQSALAIKAIEVLNVMQGHNAPEQQVSINVQSTIEKLKQCAIEYKEY